MILLPYIFSLFMETINMSTLDIAPRARNNFSPSPKPAEAYIHQDLFITVRTPSPCSRHRQDQPEFTFPHIVKELEFEIDPVPMLNSPQTQGPGAL